MAAETEVLAPAEGSKVERLLHNPWTQIVLSSLTLFYNPGMCNGLTGMGGPGQTYALYAGSSLYCNRSQNGPFVIAAGALVGVGAAFFWVAQGTVMVTYTNEGPRRREIGPFWVVFNLGGAIASLISFGLNFRSASGSVTDSTYIAYMVVMLFGWGL
ncbi:hypothetical protein D7B24_003857 [Verticillium nonalfalfae]|uniref:Uncharacterized protein n=1 Tax=Verticillium nonalfalfae TaxID=1051616 RepID=A0A3M9XVN9_9PEZI|nr:uncharacterized protein D7B24_003857 [Verticillium nonalfalfae]RNJ52347.1 hypothetical protein D7B24_003857 [Verticillium nonalfalfae]